MVMGSVNAQEFNWARQASGSQVINMTAVAVDSSDNVISIGAFDGTVDLDPGVGVDAYTSLGSAPDCFIQKFDVNGNYLWGHSLGGADEDVPIAVHTDAAENIYVQGWFRGTVDFDPGPGTFNITTAGLQSVFIVKYTPQGNFIWAKAFQHGSPYAGDFEIDASANLLITGAFADSIDLDPGTNSSYAYGNSSVFYDLFFVRLDSTGNFAWGKSITSTGNLNSSGITADYNGDLIVSGQYVGTIDLDPGAGVLNKTSNGIYDIFVAKYDQTGNLIWGTSFGSPNSEDPWQTTVDDNNNIYLSGTFQDTMDITTVSGNVKLVSNGAGDAFVMKLDPMGQILWAGSFGGPSYDHPRSIDLLNNQYVLVAGSFAGNVDFDMGTGTSFHVSNNGSSDGFLLVLDLAGNYQHVKFWGDTGWEQVTELVVTDDYIHLSSFFEGTVDFDPGTDVFSMTSQGSIDGALIQYNSCLIDTSVTVTGLILSSEDNSASYQWLDCNNGMSVIPGATGQTYTAAVNGSYAVEVTNGLCTDTSSCHYIGSVGLSRYNMMPFQIYPNPAKSFVMVRGNEDWKTSHVEILDQTSRVIYRNSISPEQPIRINVESFGSGMYFIRIGNEISPFIKQ